MRHVSPTIILLRDHYQRIGLLDYDSKDKGWSPGQVLELCKLMRISEREMAALICLKWTKMKRYMQSRFPPEVALHFCILRQWYLERTAGFVSQPAIPVGIVAR